MVTGVERQRDYMTDPILFGPDAGSLMRLWQAETDYVEKDLKRIVTDLFWVDVLLCHASIQNSSTKSRSSGQRRVS